MTATTNSFSNISIISDGSSTGTRVFAGDTEIRGLIEIDIESISVDCLVDVNLKISGVKLGITHKGEG